MYLQKLPNLNQIPAELLESIPKLEPGQVATFRSLKTSKHFDLEKNTYTVVYPRLFISYRDIVRYKGKLYPIGIPRTFAADGKVESFEADIFGAGVKFSGKFSLYGDNMQDQEKYMFLMLCNLRKGNEFRDSRYAAKIEYIDVPSESKQSRKRRSLLRSALDIAENLSMKEIKDVVSALNMNESQEEVLLRDIVEAYAETNPELFIKSYQNPSFLQSAVVKRASDAGIIYWDQRSSKVRWSDANQTTLATLEPEAAKNWVRSFSEYCTSNTAGQKAIKEIKKKLNERAPSLSVPTEPISEDVTGSDDGVGTGMASFDNL